MISNCSYIILSCFLLIYAMDDSLGDIHSIVCFLLALHLILFTRCSVMSCFLLPQTVVLCLRLVHVSVRPTIRGGLPAARNAYSGCYFPVTQCGCAHSAALVAAEYSLAAEHVRPCQGYSLPHVQFSSCQCVGLCQPIVGT